MNILVLNCGSSSIKYKLYDMTNEEYAMAGIKNCELVEYHFE